MRALAVVALLVAGPAGPAAGADRFELLTAGAADTLETKLQRAGAAGFRILDAASGGTLSAGVRYTVLLERNATPREYAVIGTDGDFDDEALGSVNALAGRGYRLDPSHTLVREVAEWWLPDQAYDDQMLVILERRAVAVPPRYAYDSLVVHEPERLYAELAERREAGYVAVGIWNSARRLRVVLEKQLDAPPPPPPADGEPFRLLIRATKPGLKRRIEKSGAEGYRVVAAADQSINAPPIVLLEKSDAADSVRYSVLYDPAKKLRKGKLAYKLNRKSVEGFRMDPRVATDRVLTLERRPAGSPVPHYMTVSSKTPEGLPRAMARAAEQGYRYMMLFVEADRASVVLERNGPGDALARRKDRRSLAHRGRVEQQHELVR